MPELFLFASRSPASGVRPAPFDPGRVFTHSLAQGAPPSHVELHVHNQP